MTAPEVLARERMLDRVFNRLRVEPDPERRKVLRYLAIAEEDRYAELQARLDKVEGWTRDGEARIALQRQLVERFDVDSAHREAAQRLLSNLEELQALLLKFQSALLDAERREPL